MWNHFNEILSGFFKPTAWMKIKIFFINWKLKLSKYNVDTFESFISNFIWKNIMATFYAGDLIEDSVEYQIFHRSVIFQDQSKCLLKDKDLVLCILKWFDLQICFIKRFTSKNKRDFNIQLRYICLFFTLEKDSVINKEKFLPLKF